MSRMDRVAALFPMSKTMALVMSVVAVVFSLSCDDGTEAQRRAVGAACSATLACSESGQNCLTQFKGGYCGVAGCTDDTDCPSGSACVTHDDGMNYCFLICNVKPDCNRSRSVDVEANCSSSAVLLVEPKDRKVCTPPSGA